MDINTEQIIQGFNDHFVSNQDKILTDLGKHLVVLETAQNMLLGILGKREPSPEITVMSTLAMQNDVLIHLGLVAMRNNCLLEEMKQQKNLGVWEEDNEAD